jgi:hypothetical protein
VRSISYFLICLLAATLGALSAAHAETSNRYCPSFLEVKGAPEPTHRGEFTFSPYTIHWSYNPEHKPVVLTSLDEQVPGDRFCGVALFTNSFGQPSTYVYVGQKFNHLLGNPHLFAKVSAGILYGYVGKYQDKVPFNHGGFSPAIIPTVGYRFNEHDSVQVNLLGNAGMMFSYGRSF